MSRRLTFACALACALALAPVAADARTGHCRPGGSGPICRVWTGHVTSVNDGDTVDVDIGGDGTRRSYPVRFIGIQAMELTRHDDNPAKWRGQCHALAAARFVERMVRRAHGRVRLTAQTSFTDGKRRPVRSVNVRIQGRWVDLGRAEMARGLTLWMHGNGETAWNRTYNRLGQRAARRHIGIWDTTTCGAGPAQDVPLKVWLMSDPAGAPLSDLNGEWIKIENTSRTSGVSLANWWVRDSGQRRFTFPRGAAIAPGQTITVYVGSGSSTADTFYWGLSEAIFGATRNGGDVGDGAYLFDPRGDLRAWLVYPCLVGCSDPNQGALSVTAHPNGRESVRVRNVSGHDVDLYGYELRLPGGYAFAKGTVLAPGEAIEVDVQGSPRTDTRRLRHIGIARPYMHDRGGAVHVSTFDEISLACDAWGSGRC